LIVSQSCEKQQTTNLMSTTCDIGDGSVTISNNAVTCAGHSGTQAAFVSINGTTTANYIRITNSQVTIALDGAVIVNSNDTPFRSVSGSVSILFDMFNHVNRRGSGVAVSCTDLSNFTFMGQNGGVLCVESGSGAGISPAVRGLCGSIVIVNGTVPVTAGYGAAIGAGVDSVSCILNGLTILGGNITAAGRNGAGIGSVYASSVGRDTDVASTTCHVGTIAIHGGNITATGSNGAGIGSGCSRSPGYGNAEASATSSVSTLAIYGGNITATGSYGAGIGSASADSTGYDMAVASATSSVSTLAIYGGKITTAGTYGSGIGSGRSGTTEYDSAVASATSFVSRLIIYRGFFDCASLKSTDCFSGSLTFANDSTIALTDRQTVGTSSRTQISGSPELYFQYIAKSAREGLASLPLLHFESITFPYSTVYNLTIRGISKPAFERTVQFDARLLRGCAVSVPDIGNYTILFNSSLGDVSGVLVHDGDRIFPVSGFYDNFYSNVSYYTPPTHMFSATDLFEPTNSCRPSELFSPTNLFTPDFGRRLHRSRGIIVKFAICSFLMSVASPFPF
jgi:hypothetical protein